MGHSQKNAQSKGHENSDIDFRVPVVLAVIIAVSTLGAYAVTSSILKVFSSQAAKNEPEMSPMSNGKVIPPEPRLQVNEALDYEKIKIEEEKKLTGYGWVDRTQGLVKIPVEKAMEKMVEQGQQASKDKKAI